MPELEIRQLYGVEGHFVRKTEVADYIKRVKQSNPRGVVLCIETEEGTQEKLETQGAFNVYLEVGKTVYIDFLGEGFDMGAITKGKAAPHETWTIQWSDVLFLEPRNMNRFGHTRISDDGYLQTVRDRITHLVSLGYSLEDIKEKIPKIYTPMPMWIKEMLIEEIIMPLYYKQQSLRVHNLTSFGVQGTVIGDQLFPIEMNRRVRFTDKEHMGIQRDDSQRDIGG